MGAGWVGVTTGWGKATSHEDFLHLGPGVSSEGHTC
jgi:hypothetical protein